MFRIFRILLRGIGQVMFQGNAWSGALMLAGIAVSSVQAALWALAGNLVGNLTARACRYSGAAIRDGLYGFNGTLVGIAVGVFFRPGWESILLLVTGSALSTWLTRLFLRSRIPGFTAPFILSTWILLGFSAWTALAAAPTESQADTTAIPQWLQAISLHFGQVMFQQNSLLTGALFLAGIAVNSPRAALFALGGAILPMGMAFPMQDYAAFNAGLFGYNGVLCAIALDGPSRRDAVWAAASVVLSTALQWAGMCLGLITLTAPFVLSTWAVLGVKYIWAKK